MFSGKPSAHPETTVQLERLVPIDDGRFPYIWITADDIDAIARTLRSEPGIETVELLATVGTEALVRLVWKEEADGLTEAILTADSTILEAIGTATQWQLTLRFPGHSQLSAFHQRRIDRRTDLSVRSVQNSATWCSGEDQSAVTDAQREALYEAFRLGYFDIPRKTTLAELEQRSGVSSQAMSERLRRGLGTLLTESLSTSETPESHSSR